MKAPGGTPSLVTEEFQPLAQTLQKKIWDQTILQTHGLGYAEGRHGTELL